MAKIAAGAKSAQFPEFLYQFIAQLCQGSKEPLTYGNEIYLPVDIILG